VWRLEFQKRGAPHFHLILFGVGYVGKDAVKKQWGEVIGQEFWDYTRASSERGPEEPYTRIERVKNRRHLLAYASKYMAKLPDGFNYISYLTGESIGRFWGVINAKKLPFAKLFEFECEFLQEVFVEFRRYANRKYAGVFRGSKLRGFTLFVDNPERWLKLWRFCLVQCMEDDW
jgi:hypothetical protein